ncbi:MAG: lipolytic enzyme family [Bryobacterales bacterium]|nr:lipolytic enzyme family [Bryobacterales bacterium]
MKHFLLLVCCLASAFAQNPGPTAPAPNAPPVNAPLLNAQDTTDLGTRAVQLMEATGVGIDGLLPATDVLRRNTAKSVESLRRNARSLVVTHQLVNQINAFLAVSDTFPRAANLPATTLEQLAELHVIGARVQAHFDALLVFTANSQATQAADPNNVHRFAEANSKLLPASQSPRVVFLGDSITDFWRLNEYFPNRDFINRGISGQTTMQMLGRFLQDVVHVNPRAVLILGGINDIARGIPVRNIEDNLTMMGDLAKAHGIRPLFGSVLPVSDYHKDVNPAYDVVSARPPASIRQLNDWLRQYCQREGFTYVDYYTAVADTNGMFPADAADDGLHPNAKGYRLMAPVAMQAVDRAVVALPPAPVPVKRRFGAAK